MNQLNQAVHVKASYTRSINLQRDGDNLELVAAYVPTSRAMQALEQIADGFSRDRMDRAHALIGPYGAGKSAFALFLSALLGTAGGDAHRIALTKLKALAPDLSQRYKKAAGKRGFLRIVINGTPDSLARQLLSALASACQAEALEPRLQTKVRAAAKTGLPMTEVLSLMEKVRQAWFAVGGSGVLIEIDELGKFMEYEAANPQRREIHLLQLLAEQAHSTHDIPMIVVVMLHQTFEYYASRSGKQLRDEWQKVQGRFSAVAFLEPAEQALRLIASSLEINCKLPSKIRSALDNDVRVLATEGALPSGMQEPAARGLLEGCYPLHPLTTLILPTLCQKVAQNERTLFTYLGSKEPYGFSWRLKHLQVGDWVLPEELYDYFILNQAGGFSDPLTYHRWMEVVTALERFEADAKDPAVRMLKTIGLLNLIGGQRGLKASPALLRLLFKDDTKPLLQLLEDASVIHFRSYSQEYRVWQGSDFDLSGALEQAIDELSTLPLTETLNALAPIKPIVARHESIVSGSLRCFVPRFIDARTTSELVTESNELRLWFYLLGEDEAAPTIDRLNDHDVTAVCNFADRLREAVVTLLALQELPKRHAALHSDPVAQREHRIWLINAESEARTVFRGLLDEPSALDWYWGRVPEAVQSRRDLQRRLSDWVRGHCYGAAPFIRNELINWEHPSPSVNTARNRLLAAMLSSADVPNLGIEKTPAEMSIYLSVLKATRLHRQEHGRWGFYPPDKKNDPCNVGEVWGAINSLLGQGGERKIAVPEVYRRLQGRPYGMKTGVLPLMLVTFLLASRREVAIYQEGAFCESLTMDNVELLCRRPELFALERFDLAGIRGDLFDRYASSVIGKVMKDATLLDIVRPLIKFVANLPPYTARCRSLGREATVVRDAFEQAKSPGLLLFTALPTACGISPDALISGDVKQTEQFIQRLVQALRDLNAAYPAMLSGWQALLGRLLLGDETTSLADLRKIAAERYLDLDQYTPDRMGLGAFIRRLYDPGHNTDQAWLESIGTLLVRVPPQKWAEENRLQAELRLAEAAEQLHDLEQLRNAVPEANGRRRGVLVKMVDAERGEFRRVLQLNERQWGAANDRANRIAESLEAIDGQDEQLAVIAMLLERIKSSYATGEGKQ